LVINPAIALKAIQARTLHQQRRAARTEQLARE